MCLFPLFPLVPEQVTGVRFTLNNTNNVLTLTITWNIPSSEQPITHYFVRLDETQQPTKVVGVTTLTITGTPGKTYTFRVRAVSAGVFGEWSESVTTQRKYIQKSVSHLPVHICRQCTVLIKINYYVILCNLCTKHLLSACTCRPHPRLQKYSH